MIPNDMNNYLVMDTEPFLGFMPEDFRRWLQEHTSESELASAMMQVSTKVGMLMHECDEDHWANYAFEEWADLETEIVEKIRRILAMENQTKGTNHQLDGVGLHFVIKPFMERHGYRDGSGWWIKDA